MVVGQADGGHAQYATLPANVSVPALLIVLSYTLFVMRDVAEPAVSMARNHGALIE